MEDTQKRVMYKVIFLPDAEASFKKLDKMIRLRVAEKIDWLSENANKIIHHPLKSLLVLEVGRAFQRMNLWSAWLFYFEV